MGLIATFYVARAHGSKLAHDLTETVISLATEQVLGDMRAANIIPLFKQDSRDKLGK